MKTPKKTFEKKHVAKPVANKNSTEEDDDILDVKIIADDFDLPLDDIANFEDFDDDDSY